MPGQRQQQHGGQIEHIQRQTCAALPPPQRMAAEWRQQQHQRHGRADRDLIAAELGAHRQSVAVHQAGKRQRQRQVQNCAVQKLNRQ